MTKLSKLFSIVLFILSVTAPVSWSETLSGTVTDASTSQPINGATVTIVELGQSRTTNSSGQYDFGNVANGTYTLRASATGYITQDIPLTLPKPPAAPTGLTITVGNRKLDLDWNDNTELDLAGYNVYRSLTSGSGYTKLNTSLLTSSMYSDTGLVNGTTYYYRVSAVDTSNNESSYATKSAAPSGSLPSLILSTNTIYFDSLNFGQTKSMTFTITNSGSGTLSGTISDDQEWITVDPTQFAVSAQDGPQTITVTVDNNILKQTQGEYTGIILIDSNAGIETVKVIVSATCVLVKPNPYNPNKGLLTFFGDGIVPGQTTIKIYTLSGELVKQLTSEAGKQFVWDGKTENGEPVASGIYLYTYESPKEKGTSKFTVIIK